MHLEEVANELSTRAAQTEVAQSARRVSSVYDNLNDHKGRLSGPVAGGL